MNEDALKWKALAKGLMQMGHLLKKEKKILLPPSSATPSSEIEALTDLWFLNAQAFDHNVKFSVRPSDEIVPWVLVRLTVASARAQYHGDMIPTPKPPLKTIHALRLLCVNEWHACLKKLWAQSGQKIWQGRS